jgi:hypothetical protein
MARMVIQSKVISAREKDSLEDQLNHFLSTLEMDNFIGVQYQESSGIFSALVLYKVKRG